MSRRDPGVALVNVLVLLALSAAVLVLMFDIADAEIARAQRFAEASEARALLIGAEQAAIAALRRDPPDIDHPGEPWGQAQETIAIRGGGFRQSIEDARGLFNVNDLVGGGVAAAETFDAILAARGLPVPLTQRITGSIVLEGPLRRLDDLTRRIGLSPDELAALRPLVTALPVPGELNVNAVPEALLAILLGDPAKAADLVALRAEEGFLAPGMVAAAGVTLPPGLGYRSDLFRSRATARIGETTQSMVSLLWRREGEGGVELLVIERGDAFAGVPVPPPVVERPR